LIILKILFLSRFGPRFPAVSRAYDRNLRAAAMQISREMGIENRIHEGVYSCIGGPNYETVAELAAMKILGIDAIGEFTTNTV
jgi:purine-nucleoside phosphorylase